MTTTPQTPAQGVTLAEYVGDRHNRDGAFIAECEAAAEGMVAALLPVPETVLNEGARALRRQAVLAAGANLWSRRRRLTEAGGVVDGQIVATPERPTRDPLDAARHILAPLLGPGIA